MPFFAGLIRKIFLLVPLLLFLLPAGYSQAQNESPHEPLDIATILHPPLDEPVPPLDTLILIGIDEYYTGPDHFFLVLLDDTPVQARWDPDAHTFSYYPDRMLETGMHSIKVYMTIVDEVENQLIADGAFTVSDAGRPPVPMAPGTLFDLGARQSSPPPSPVTSQYSTDFFSLSGRASVDVTSVDFEGLGSRLRQEPDNTSIFNLNGRGRSGATDFDFRFYMTTDETSYQQPRNRYLFNIDQENYGFAIGDTNPRYTSLMLDGMRVRGAEGWASFGPFTLHAVNGESRRETETRYNEDSQIIGRGRGAQNFWATRLGLWEDEDFSVGVSYLSGQEEEADIDTTGNPGENIVKAYDFLWSFDNSNGSVRGVWAEADYDYDDPERDDVSGAEGREVEVTYLLRGHTLKLKYQLIDPGFTSLGRLSLQKDRETWAFEDRLYLSNGGLTGRLYVERYHNNVSDTLDFTTRTLRYGGQLRYRFSLRGPTLVFGYMQQDRTNDVIVGESGRIDDSMETLNLGLVQTVYGLDARHDLRVDWRSSDRTNVITPTGDSTQESITVTLTSRWDCGFQLDLLYGNTDSDYTNRDRFTSVDRYSVRGAYTVPSRSWNLWTRWEGVNSDGNQSTYDSNRDTIEMGFRWFISSDLSLETSVQMVEFNDNLDNANDFKEHSFTVMLIQLLN